MTSNAEIIENSSKNKQEEEKEEKNNANVIKSSFNFSTIIAQSSSSTKSTFELIHAFDYTCSNNRGGVGINSNGSNEKLFLTNVYCGKCNSCQILSNLNNLKQWFERASHVTVKKFLFGLVYRIKNVKLLKYLNDLLSPLTECKDYIYARNKYLPSCDEDHLKATNDRCLDERFVEKQIDLIWHWYVKSSYFIKLNFILSVLRKCDQAVVFLVMLKVKSILEAYATNKEMTTTLSTSASSMRIHEANLKSIILEQQQQQQQQLKSNNNKNHQQKQQPSSSSKIEEKINNNNNSSSKTNSKSERYYYTSENSDTDDAELEFDAFDDDEDDEDEDRTDDGEMNEDAANAAYVSNRSMINLDLSLNTTTAASKQNQLKLNTTTKKQQQQIVSFNSLKKVDFVRQLPVHLSKYILSLLDRKSLYNCLFVCKYWSNLIREVHKLNFMHKILLDDMMFLRVKLINKKNLYKITIESFHFISNKLYIFFKGHFIKRR